MISKYRNSKSNYQIKTEYYPKDMLYPYDNKVPGPGSCKPFINVDIGEQNKSRIKSNHQKSTFGFGEKLKLLKQSVTGPGS